MNRIKASIERSWGRAHLLWGGGARISTPNSYHGSFHCYFLTRHRHLRFTITRSLDQLNMYPRKTYAELPTSNH